MNKKILSIIMGLLLVLSLGACASNTNQVAEPAIVAPKPNFIVGFDAEYPPYGYMDAKGNYTGFDLELAEEVCNRNDWNLVKQPIDWDTKDMTLNSGSIDCIWNGFTMNGRENDYTFSVPYVDNSIVFVVKNENAQVTLDDLAGKVVGTQAGSSALASIEEQLEDEGETLAKTFKAVEQSPDFNTCFMNLESGVIDAVAVDIGVAKYQLNNNKNKYVIIDQNFTSEQYAVGFKKGNTSLKDEVEKTLFDMYKDGTFMNIAKKYSEYNLPDMVCIQNYVK